jgi:hypothetical protein
MKSTPLSADSQVHTRAVVEVASAQAAERNRFSNAQSSANHRPRWVPSPKVEFATTLRWREMDSNPRSPVGETDVGHPDRPLQDKNVGCSSMLEAPRTAR